MSVAQLPAGSAPPEVRGRWALLAGAAVGWGVLYWLNLPWWDWLVYDMVGLERETRLAESVHFFFYDVTKIALLLTGVIFVVTVLRSFMSVERTRALLGGRREGVGNVLASSLGVVTPFCSCSAVPAFIGFVAAGGPAGGDSQFSDCVTVGERGGHRVVARPVRLEDHGALCGGWDGHRDRCRVCAGPVEA